MILESNEKRVEDLTQYVQENQAKLYRLAYSYCQNSELAMDILQEAITKALSKLYLLREERYLQTWFYRILINEAIRFSKKNKKEMVFHIEDYDREVIQEDKTISMDLYRSIQQLKPKYKTVIVLRYFEDRKIEEIAQITGTNLNTIKSRLYKALEELKNNMEGEREE